MLIYYEKVFYEEILMFLKFKTILKPPLLNGGKMK